MNPFDRFDLKSVGYRPGSRSLVVKPLDENRCTLSLRDLQAHRELECDIADLVAFSDHGTGFDLSHDGRRAQFSVTSEEEFEVIYEGPKWSPWRASFSKRDWAEKFKAFREAISDSRPELTSGDGDAQV